MMNKFFYILILTFVIIISCEKFTYTPHGKNFVDVSKPNATPLTVNLNSPNPLYIWGEAELIYQLSLNEKNLFRIYFFLDSQWISLI